MSAYWLLVAFADNQRATAYFIFIIGDNVSSCVRNARMLDFCNNLKVRLRNIR